MKQVQRSIFDLTPQQIQGKMAPAVLRVTEQAWKNGGYHVRLNSRRDINAQFSLEYGDHVAFVNINTANGKTEVVKRLERSSGI